ncbi:MAG: alpha/beta fold hydrolase, partial [Nanoarchaeota archaeon]
APDMPTPWKPDYSEWKKIFEQFTISEKTILVGHSCGAAFLVHWLVETGNKVKKLILVAPSKNPENENDIQRGLMLLLDSSLRKDLVDKGSKRVRLFNWQSTAKEILKLFREVINEKS